MQEPKNIMHIDKTLTVVALRIVFLVKGEGSTRHEGGFCFNRSYVHYRCAF